MPLKIVSKIYREQLIFHTIYSENGKPLEVIFKIKNKQIYNYILIYYNKNIKINVESTIIILIKKLPIKSGQDYLFTSNHISKIPNTIILTNQYHLIYTNLTRKNQIIIYG